MDPEHLFFDERFGGFCVFCGGAPETRDHVPSKTFLQEPYPEQLPVVEACRQCNGGFSSDEEYLSCFLEVVLAGTTDPAKLHRPKVSRALLRNGKLRKNIEDSLEVGEHGAKTWNVDLPRAVSVMTKLARGHAAFELSLPQLEVPVSVGIRPLLTMSTEERAAFETIGEDGIVHWPEVGSRAFLRAAGAEPDDEQPGPWIDVQDGWYRYAVEYFGGISVRIVMREYLACQVTWDE